jgi:hypothetical protein
MELKTGVFMGITNAEYHRLDAVSRSYLQGLRTVPAEARVKDEHSGSMGLGTAGHTYILEPHKFDTEVIESKNKTSNSKDFQALVEAYPDKCIVTAGSIEKVREMCVEIYKHPKAREILEADKVIEPTVLWQDEGTGIWCKTRPDIMIPDRRIFADLKFLAPGKADPRKFSWAVRDYGYDLQAAGNILGMKRATGVLYTEFWFIVVETDAPYRVACYQLDEDWLGDALYEWHSLLQVEAECRGAGIWPNFTKDNIEGETLFRGI